MRNTTAATNRRASTRLFALSVLLALAAILAISSAVPAAPPPAAPAAVPAQATTDYDTDDDGYIEIGKNNNHAQLNVIRYDLDGNGDPTAGAGATAYAAAFPNRDTNAATRMGCPGGACVGYELVAHINLDTNGDSSHTSADTYYNGGAGWIPIGTDSAKFTANFRGGGWTVQNLTINRTGSTVNDQGLFGSVGSSSRIESLGVTGASVAGRDYTGVLIGRNHGGTIVACYTTGSVSGTNYAGGLVGWNGATISTSYTHASVSGTDRVGGLAGSINNVSAITNSYSIGSVTGTTRVGGLIGQASSGATITKSYWNTTTSGQSGSSGGGGQSTTALQGATTYTGIFSDWNINLDGVAGNDDPWDFGGSSAYPTLIYYLTDYDRDEDGFIDIANLAQLNAMRRNLNGRGDASGGVWDTAFPNRVTSASKRMGCPSGTCTGFELVADLDFDTNGNGIVGTDTGDAYYNSGNGWDPIGRDTSAAARWATTFKGNGHTINNLFINRPNEDDVGLFGSTHTNSRIESLGVTNANVTGDEYVAILVGSLYGNVVACYSTGAVTGTNNGVGQTEYGTAGGLVGWAGVSTSPITTIRSSYSTASVAGYASVGGLVGQAQRVTLTHSYSIGRVTRTGGTISSTGGLVGFVNHTYSTVTASYCNTETSGQSNCSGNTASGVEGKTTAELQAPTDYGASSGDIYYGWDANIDGQAGNDDPWDFGGATDYPLLRYGGHTTFKQGRGDFDDDNDGYIDITTLAQLDAVRHDLDANGTPTAGAGTTAYNAAFPSRETGAANLMGCPAGACTGYELLNDLDFDSDGDGDVDANDHGGAYWDSGDGWAPMGSGTDDLEATFKGNGYTINNLFINRASTNSIGLFYAVGSAGRVETLGITNADVRGANWTGILAGFSYNDVVACYTTGSVAGGANTGGLIGLQQGSGTLVHSSYSTASVSGAAQTGGLVGNLASGNVTNSYSTGRVTATGVPPQGGLLGFSGGGGAATASYWDTQTSGQATSGGGSGAVAKTTAELQSVTGYTGIFADWNADIDGVTGNDDPWNFCTGRQYPALKYGGHDPLRQGSCGDYDIDDDGYIDIFTLAELNGIRYDPDGNGDPISGNLTFYNNAFPNRITAAATRMGCPSGACTGYELLANLDFDENGDGSITSADATYWNGGAGWLPIGDSSTPWATNFRGNGHTINNLFISRSSTSQIGLFGDTGSGRIETLGVINADVRGATDTGILVGENSAAIVASYTTGKVHGTDQTGGLVGLSFSSGSFNSTYSTAYVIGNQYVGGLVGFSNSRITNSYSTGKVTGSNDVGGFLGYSGGGARQFDNYYDTAASGRSGGIGGVAPGGNPGSNTGVTGKTPRELQTVTDYSGIYANWNANLDGESGNDDPWAFGNVMQYPMLDYQDMPIAPQGGLAMGIPDNWNAPVAGERINVCLVDGPSMRGIVSGQTYKEPWIWEWSADGGTGWTAISGAGNGDSPPTYEYSPTATDVGRYLRAKVKLTDGTFAYTRALGGPVVAASGATAAPSEARFARGHAAPQVGVEIVARDPRPSTRVVDVRAGWQRCPNTEAPHSDCTYIAGYPEGHWWIRYTPTDDDIGNYLRMYVYYQNVDGTWTRRVTPFTTGVVAAATP